MFCLLFATPVCLTLRSLYRRVLFLVIQWTRLNYRDSAQLMKHHFSSFGWKKKHGDVFLCVELQSENIEGKSNLMQSVESLHKKVCFKSNSVRDRVKIKLEIVHLTPGIWLFLAQSAQRVTWFTCFMFPLRLFSLEGSNLGSLKLIS